MGQPVPFCPTRSSVPPRRTLGSSLNLPLRSCARYVPGPSSSKDVYICVRVHVISQQCMYIYIYMYIYIHLSISLSLSLSLRTFIYVCLSIYLFINLSLHLYLSICLSVCLSVYLCLSVWLAACLLCIYLNLSESIYLCIIYVSMYLWALDKNCSSVTIHGLMASGISWRIEVCQSVAMGGSSRFGVWEFSTFKNTRPVATATPYPINTCECIHTRAQTHTHIYIYLVTLQIAFFCSVLRKRGFLPF